MTKRTNQDRLLAALENLTATVSDLRKKGYNIEARTNRTEDGKSYTRYSLIKNTNDDINQVA